MAHVVLLPFGSAGDVFPFIWLGRQLQARGHRVTVITACLFDEAVRKAGFNFVPIGRAEEFEAMIADPRIWRLYEGTKLVFSFAGQSVEPYACEIEALAASPHPPDLLMAPMTAFGARLMREKTGVPLITVHLQPAALLSAHETPVILPGMEHFRRLPLWLKRFFLSLPNPAERFALPAVHRACSARGITPPCSLLREWWDSPDGSLLLFPEWFAAPQPDWPPQRLQWDFPLEDLAQEMPLSAELTAFLAAGEKPVVFTAGSANVHARSFFHTAVMAAQQAGCRAVLVTRRRDLLPDLLPPSVFWVEYAPFSSLLLHAAAFVHHGGIGTLAQGFAAGVPQLVMPLAHDQPDNAFRLRQAGAGLVVPPRRFKVGPVAAALRRLREDETITANCARIRQQMQQRAGVDGLCAWIAARMKGYSTPRK